MQEPLVSIIIPAYNRPAYLKEAIQSAVNQEYKNLEIIVADDGSDENPQSIVAAFRDSRLRLRRNPANLGACLNNLNAFREARGKYVANLHDDDLWHTDFLSKLVPHLEANPALALAFCNHFIINADGSLDYSATEENTRHWKRDTLQEGIYRPFCEMALIHHSVPTVVGAVIRKDAIDWEDFRVEAESAYDVYLTYLACRDGRGAYYLPERLSRYRHHPASTTSQGRSDWLRGLLFCYDSFAKDARLSQFEEAFRQKSVVFRTALAIALLREGQPRSARHYALQSLRQNPDLRLLAVFLLGFVPPSVLQRYFAKRRPTR